MLIMTDFKYFSLDKANQANGLVVVIDVLRAFTSAAYAFNGGAEKILPVAGVKEALQLRKRIPGSLIMGEVGGVKPPEFDIGNSPASISKLNLNRKIIIQRTSAGTQGIVLAKNADQLFAASFVVAKATAETIHRLNPEVVSFIITGESMGRDGDEDRACGEYIQKLINDWAADHTAFIHRVGTSSAGRSFLEGENFSGSEKDFELSIQTNIFPFALPVHRKDSLLIMCCDKS